MQTSQVIYDTFVLKIEIIETKKSAKNISKISEIQGKDNQVSYCLIVSADGASYTKHGERDELN